ncbi:MAG: hypothetical protein SH847_05415 [Roseiflexaceae bacterium]|nr:hypothetical protein [Roseiflexaceae bacterium]
MIIDDRFRGPLAAPWHTLQQNGGRAIILEDGLRLATAGATRRLYANAQIDDYTGLKRHMLPWRPPLSLRIEARFPTPLAGTAGFGFWNNPISPLGSWPALPATLWFFYASPPSNMALVLTIPGSGWKAATLDTTTRSALTVAPLAPAVLLLNRIPAIRRTIWPRIQHTLRIAEADLGLPSPQWCTYEIEWRNDGASFSIDRRVVLETDQAPQGPLGFVAWVDTQWLIATPQGRFGWGLLDVPQAQYLDIRSIQIG